MIILTTQYFEVEQPENCIIPGYLIVRSKKEAAFLSELSAEALMNLGPLLARGMQAIQKVVSPERIYIVRFGEEVEAIHFHLFPRTKAMSQLYKAQHPSLPPASGAMLFDWARRPEVAAALHFPLTMDQATPLLREYLLNA